MANFPVVSPSELSERRRQRRRQRRLRAIQAFWRFLVVVALTGGSIWLIKSPVWIVQSAEQIEVEGNELLSAERVRSLLPIRYPKPLWAIQPDALAEHLEAGGPIAQATITRHLLPPGLHVEIQERRPVAIAQAYQPLDPGVSTLSQSGLLDATGAWIPLEDYSRLSASMDLPKLTVVGMREGDREQWEAIYAELQHFQTTTQNPVQISELDWQRPDNLILTTDLGIVHLGVYRNPERLAEQLQALNQMRNLPESFESTQIKYIDLQRPEYPSLQMR
ncbi:MAG: FtsQ-type POTRA domain-containing protein [Cyanobacteria bacterium J06638_20]